MKADKKLLLTTILLSFTLLMGGCAPTSTTSGTEVAVEETQPDTESEHEDEHAHEKEEEHEHQADHAHEDEHEAESDKLTLPALEAADLDGQPLKVVATTSIIGDVVAQVGGEAIALTTLMGPGQDPHSYEPAARDLTTVTEADVLFVNGWDLEESLIHDLENIGGDVPLVPISADIAPLSFEGHDHEEEADHEEEHHEDEHGHSGADPHVWFDLHHVEQWVANVEQVLSTRDPANAEQYARNAAAYLDELEALTTYTQDQLTLIPDGRRLLVTNHDSFSYFAHAYDFEVVGTVLPSFSTLAEPSASDLADLIAVMETHDLCVMFSETTVSDRLAQTVAAELNHCEQVQLLPIYTGALGPEGSEADSYLGMFRANVDTIVAGLQ